VRYVLLEISLDCSLVYDPATVAIEHIACERILPRLHKLHRPIHAFAHVGMTHRFPGHFLSGQDPHINLELGGLSIHINYNRNFHLIEGEENC
jgi:hypothetical protein